MASSSSSSFMVAPPHTRRLRSLSLHLLPPPPSTPPLMELAPTSSSSPPSAFQHLPQAPDDPILGVTIAYNKDPSPSKLNLGVGAYRTEEGKPYVLRVVREAEQRLVNDLSRNKEYLLITGIPKFNQLSAKLILGEESPAIREKRVCTAQCLSGTGSLRVGAEFLAKHYSQGTIYIPTPTWGNHPKVFGLGGLAVKNYRYYDPRSRGLDYEGKYFFSAFHG